MTRVTIQPYWLRTVGRTHAPDRAHRFGTITAAARRRSTSPTDKVQLALAVLWLLDGSLQLQPALFTRRFATAVILPASAGEPALISRPVHLAGQLILLAPAAFNALFAATQLAIGAGILLRRTSRTALAASAVWSLAVWVFGESLGGLAAPGAMFLTGAPGAAALYGLLSLAATPSHESPAWWLRPTWTALWLGAAALQILGGPAATAHAVATNAQAAPSLLHSVDTAALAMFPRGGGLAFTALVGIQIVVALAPFIAGRVRALAAALAVATAVAFWVVGQSLGALWTGVATDPNAGPVFVLLALAVLAAQPPPDRRGRWWRRSQVTTAHETRPAGGSAHRARTTVNRFRPAASTQPIRRPRHRVARRLR